MMVTVLDFVSNGEVLDAMMINWSLIEELGICCYFCFYFLFSAIYNFYLKGGFLGILKFEMEV